MRHRASAFKVSRRTTVGILIIALVAVGSAGAWAATRSSSPSAVAPTLVGATTSTLRQSVSATGTLEPAHRAELSFAVSGTVTSVPVAVGDQVKLGTVLATVDPADLQSALTLASATVSATQAQLTAEGSAGSTAVQIASTQAQLADAQSRLADAKTALAAASMSSPIAGTVAQVNIATGDKVGSGTSAGASSAASAASSSTAQIIVISTTSWVVDASVGSTDLPQLKRGLQAEITPTGSTTKVFGTVKSVGIVASSSSGGSASFPVTIAVTGSPKGLYAGGAATVAIVVKQVQDVLTVPTSALHTEKNETVVHQMTNGAQVSTPVTVGTTYGPVTEIVHGLKAGDKVIVTSARTGVPGSTGGNRVRQGGGTGFGGGDFNGPPPGAGAGN